MARTRAQDFDEKQRGILDLAAAVFADKGMEKASMSQIAAHAQVSKALLYHYYPSKDALIFAIIVTHLEELDAAIAAADDPKLEPPDRLQGNFRLADGHPADTQLLGQFALARQPCPGRISALVDQLRDLFRDRLEESLIGHAPVFSDKFNRSILYQFP